MSQQFTQPSSAPATAAGSRPTTPVLSAKGKSRDSSSPTRPEFPSLGNTGGHSKSPASPTPLAPPPASFFQQTTSYGAENVEAPRGRKELKEAKRAEKIEKRAASKAEKRSASVGLSIDTTAAGYQTANSGQASPARSPSPARPPLPLSPKTGVTPVPANSVQLAVPASPPSQAVSGKVLTGEVVNDPTKNVPTSQIPSSGAGAQVAKDVAAQKGYSGAQHTRAVSNGKTVMSSGQNASGRWDQLFSGMNPDSMNVIIAEYVKNVDMSKFIENISYQGFNRIVYIEAALRVISVSQFCRLGLIGAIRGSNFDKLRKNAEHIDEDLTKLVDGKVVVVKPKKKTDISILRCTASIPHWCAYFMMQAGVPPKIPDSRLPSFLQFPAAASLPMSADLRKDHIQFSIDFSNLIGGSFNINIYLAAYSSMIPLNEVPDVLRLQLGVQTAKDAKAIDVKATATELSKAVAKA